MASGIYTALAGAMAQSEALDVASNNVANANTTGYKAERVRFGEVLGRARGKQQDSSFVQVTGTAIDPSPGALSQTGQPLDVALRGDGLFGVTTPQGVRYTRDGAFRIGKTGALENGDGFAVRGLTGQPIKVPAGTASVSIGADGVVNADGAQVGTLEVVRFPPTALERTGARLFAARGKPLAGPRAEVVAGALESSNFNVVRGVVDLVRLSRTYDATHRMIESFREIDDRTARGVGGR